MAEMLFRIQPMADIDEVWQMLESAGCSLLYSSEEVAGDQSIIGYLPTLMSADELMAKHSVLLAVLEAPLGEIDWEAQWEAHGAHYRDGYLHIDAREYAPKVGITKWPIELRLQPGAGFGDLSHPTTRLVLKMMGDKVAEKSVLDIGSGSGVLSLVALAMGAREVCGIDIDEEAVVHARLNGILNGMGEAVSFSLPEEYCRKEGEPPQVILMNMIQMEQAQAWQSLPIACRHAGIAITSGILKEGRQAYLEQCKSWGWQLCEEQEEDGWLGFCFRIV